MSNSFNEKLDATVANIWMDGEKFAEQVYKHKNPDRNYPEVRQAEFSAYIREFVLSEIVGEDEKSVVPRLYKLFKPRNELRAEQRNKILKALEEV